MNSPVTVSYRQPPVVPDASPSTPALTTVMVLLLPSGLSGIVPFKYGPYLKGAIPDNPEGSNNTIIVVSAGVLGLASAGAGGWRYDTVTGEFIADH